MSKEKLGRYDTGFEQELNLVKMPIQKDLIDLLGPTSDEEKMEWINQNSAHFDLCIRKNMELVRMWKQGGAAKEEALAIMQEAMRTNFRTQEAA